MKKESIELIPVECPTCGETIFFVAEEGEQEFKCQCGYENTLVITKYEE